MLALAKGNPCHLSHKIQQNHHNEDHNGCRMEFCIQALVELDQDILMWRAGID